MEKIIFKCKDKIITNGQPTRLCGILNVTPDSFSDGGNYFDSAKAVAQAKKLIADGADMIDIGGESTRPGSTLVTAEEEVARIIPVIKALKAETDIIISVDTWKATVAQTAIAAGADIINDITGLLGDPAMAGVIANSDAGLIAMFNPVILRPEHPSATLFPRFGSGEAFSIAERKASSTAPIHEAMLAYFKKSLAIAHVEGIDDDRIMLDAGIGFGLTKRENLQLLQSLGEIHQLGYLSFLGVSRKRFIINLLQETGFNADMKTADGLELVDYASAFLTAIAASVAVNVLRVHDIPKHLQAKAIGDAIRLADSSADIHFAAYKK